MKFLTTLAIAALSGVAMSVRIHKQQTASGTTPQVYVPQTVPVNTVDVAPTTDNKPNDATATDSSTAPSNEQPTPGPVVTQTSPPSPKASTGTPAVNSSGHHHPIDLSNASQQVKAKVNEFQTKLQQMFQEFANNAAPIPDDAPQSVKDQFSKILQKDYVRVLEGEMKAILKKNK